jgi:hypothetical protein
MLDDHLPPDQLAAPALRSALTQAHARVAELEREVTHLRGCLARQNEAIIRLETENRRLRRELQDLRTLLAGVTEQNALLRQQVAALQRANARLRGDEPQAEHQPDPWPSETTKRSTGTRPRKKRKPEHNHGRRRAEEVDRRVRHVVETCPHCGSPLQGGWVHRRVQTIDLPPPPRALVVEHELVARRCPGCRRPVVAAPPGLEHGRIGRYRFGPRLIALVAVMATVERLPGRQIRERLEREYGLRLSQGGLIGLLQLAARQAEGAYERLGVQIRGSPVVHADETGWRPGGVPGYIWAFSTARVYYFHYDAHRSKDVPDGVLGEDFAGTLVTDFYASYDHYPGPKQRCWSHLWREIRQLVKEHPKDAELAAWVAGVRAIYQAATGERPAAERGTTPEASRAREERARRYERLLLELCPESMSADRPEATLAKRCRKYIAELFTFVRDPQVPPTNNAAERSLRPLVIARKISGGTRTATGSKTRMILASVLGTARLQGQDPIAVCQGLLLAQPPTPPDSAPTT